MNKKIFAELLGYEVWNDGASYCESGCDHFPDLQNMAGFDPLSDEYYWKILESLDSLQCLHISMKVSAHRSSDIGIVEAVYYNKQFKWVPLSEDTSTDNLYRMGPKEREFWDKCNEILKDVSREARGK